ncbi:DHHC_palmitoyltransferase [Hexamita inflata]|uniref:Palmitoyltransferase n=1 Tax=Hexamita inflata TaxID=28002 RepID=A0AA86R974_9EUKA|nr:DHHC palmitoyltransferase [Hexamita inflata]
MKLIQYFNLESLSQKATRQLTPGEYWSIITHVVLSILGVINFIVFSLPNNSIWCNLFSSVLLFYTILQQSMCAVTCSLMNPGYVVESVKAPIEIEEVESSTVRIEEMNLNEYNCDACDEEIVATPENDPLYEYHPLKQAVNHEASDSFDQDDEFNPLIYDHSIQHQTVNQQPSPQAIENFCLICQCSKLENVHHCHVCNSCVQNFDHHCSFIGNCVGLNSWPYFFKFTFYATASNLISMSCDLVGILSTDLVFSTSKTLFIAVLLIAQFYAFMLVLSQFALSANKLGRNLNEIDLIEGRNKEWKLENLKISLGQHWVKWILFGTKR